MNDYEKCITVNFSKSSASMRKANIPAYKHRIKISLFTKTECEYHCWQNRMQIIGESRPHQATYPVTLNPDFRSRIWSGSCPKIQWAFPIVILFKPTKFHENPPVSFWEILVWKFKLDLRIYYVFIIFVVSVACFIIPPPKAGLCYHLCVLVCLSVCV